MRNLLLFVCSLVGVTLFAAPVVSDLKVTPIEPIGLAIDYTVSGATEGKVIPLSVRMGNGTETYVAKTLTGATNCVNGAHRVYWNVAKDGITLGEVNLDVTVEYAFPLYCVIDLTKGTSAESYPVTYQYVPPSSGFNTTEYKTTKLVLKRVDEGKFKMGNSTDVTLTKTFYMGLFEVTQKQWDLVMGSNSCTEENGKDDVYPVYYVSYDMIRGSSEGANWPTSNSVDGDSFLGKLRAKTGVDFDLPTEAQWEYTCRAGTTTTYWYGDSANGDCMWYRDNSSYISHAVGTRQANEWGFYDVNGNVGEWCLDWYDSSLSGGVDPVGPSSGSYRVVRGGGCKSDASRCTSSNRKNSYDTPSQSDGILGIRLSRTLP